VARCRERERWRRKKRGREVGGAAQRRGRQRWAGWRREEWRDRWATAVAKPHCKGGVLARYLAQRQIPWILCVASATKSPSVAAGHGA
jgi:hypothetical protein